MARNEARGSEESRSCFSIFEQELEEEIMARARVLSCDWFCVELRLVLWMVAKVHTFTAL